jgi:hypothetical protein
MRVVLVVLIGAVVWTGRGFLLRQQQPKQRPKLTVAQVEAQLPAFFGWRGEIKDLHCTGAPSGSRWDYLCTFTNYGTAANARANRGGTVMKTGVRDVNGKPINGEAVTLDRALPAPAPGY